MAEKKDGGPPLKCPGVGRDKDCLSALQFYFSRRVTDDEMRFLHEVMQRAAACIRDKPCTCHPDDNPPDPCAKKYAYSECAASEGEVDVEGLNKEAEDFLCDQHGEWDDEGEKLIRRYAEALTKLAQERDACNIARIQAHEDAEEAEAERDSLSAQVQTLREALEGIAMRDRMLGELQEPRAAQEARAVLGEA